MAPGIRVSRPAVAEWLRHPRYEVIPLPGTEDKVAAHVPGGVTLTVTASPARGLDPTVDLTQRLSRRGFPVVPHIAARLVTDRKHLSQIVAGLSECGVKDVFVIGGDAREPVGDFGAALDVLVAMHEIGHPFTDIGIAGYPESNPKIDDDITIQAMWDKRHYATYIVSQVCFDPAITRAWVARVRRRGVHLPIYVGLPGVAEQRRLLAIATRIGLGESARFLRRHKRWMWRMLLPGAYRPDRLLAGLAPAVTDAAQGIAGVHMFTFNELAATEAWRRATLDRLAGQTAGGATG
jgi:methylenetetrahydrofolate reductase (NADPH)